MKAWLITWEWGNDASAVADLVAAVLPPRWTSERVLEHVEWLYARATSNVTELAAYAKHPKSNPYRAKSGVRINGLVHGERITCGANPWLYARKVADLKIAKGAGGFEKISWREPDSFKKSEGQPLEVAQKGQVVIHTRQIKGSLSDELIWDRGTRTWKPGFDAPDV